jgi:IS30 family transposase
LTPAQGNYTFAIIVIEYFTKWIEAKLLTNVTVDDDKYFDNIMFKEFYQQISTKVASASVYHPQSNGAVEKTNSLIFQAMKKILEGAKKENGRKSCQR